MRKSACRLRCHGRHRGACGKYLQYPCPCTFRELSTLIKHNQRRIQRRNNSATHTPRSLRLRHRKSRVMRTADLSAAATYCSERPFGSSEPPRLPHSCRRWNLHSVGTMLRWTGTSQASPDCADWNCTQTSIRFYDVIRQEDQAVNTWRDYGQTEEKFSGAIDGMPVRANVTRLSGRSIRVAGFPHAINQQFTTLKL